jgi:DNA-binding transcriptional regulator GbsR (MarR family)
MTNNSSKTDSSAKVRDDFLENIGRLGESLGLNRMTCQLYALLYLNDGVLSLSELNETLKISKGSASLNIRKLEEWGAVRRVWKKGSNKDYYQANHNPTTVILRKLKSGLEERSRILNTALIDLQADIKKLGRTKDKTLRLYQKKIAEVQTVTKKLNRVLKNFPHLENLWDSI